MMKILSILLFFAFGLKAQELIPYLKDGEYGYSDISGNIMIAPKYDKAMVFDSDGVAYAQLGEYEILLAKNGKELSRHHKNNRPYKLAVKNNPTSNNLSEYT